MLHSNVNLYYRIIIIPIIWVICLHSNHLQLCSSDSSGGCIEILDVSVSNFQAIFTFWLPMFFPNLYHEMHCTYVQYIYRDIFSLISSSAHRWTTQCGSATKIRTSNNHSGRHMKKKRMAIFISSFREFFSPASSNVAENVWAAWGHCWKEKFI